MSQQQISYEELVEQARKRKADEQDVIDSEAEDSLVEIESSDEDDYDEDGDSFIDDSQASIQEEPIQHISHEYVHQDIHVLEVDKGITWSELTNLILEQVPADKRKYNLFTIKYKH